MKNVATDMEDVIDNLTNTITSEISISDIPTVNGMVRQENTYLTKNYSNNTEVIKQSTPVVLEVDGKALGKIIVPLYDKEKNRLGVALS